MEEIKQTVKRFILGEFLPGEDASQLTDTTPLIAGGILDSVATVKLIVFLEERYGITVEDDETNEENLGTLSGIGRFVQSKL
jgi:acyl carrier protein